MPVHRSRTLASIVAYLFLVGQAALLLLEWRTNREGQGCAFDGKESIRQRPPKDGILGDTHPYDFLTER